MKRRHAPTLAALLCAASSLVAREAHAYGWMVSRGYAGCAMCHADPSGGSLLTRYGRALGDLELRAGSGSGDGSADESSGAAGFLFGLIEEPEWLRLGGDVRGLGLVGSVGDAPAQARAILMQADLAAEATVDRVRAHVSLGFVSEGARPATLVGDEEGEDGALVSRTHWIGVELGRERSVFLRAGRIHLPFGLRMVEHTAFVRAATRTDTNAAQQHGIALAHVGTAWRAEVMGIAGNFQVSPDEYRSRGYAGYAEWAARPEVVVGVSSLVTHAARDTVLLEPAFRHAHGAFARVVPRERVVLSLEADLTALSGRERGTRAGVALWAQVDYELRQGLHLMAAAEAMGQDLGSDGLSLGLWAGAAWFFAPHSDVRVDGVLHTLDMGPARVGAESLLAQLHLYL